MAEEAVRVVKSSELRVKDVVNVVDGRKLGAITDLELDLDRGVVTALIVAGPSRLKGFFGREQDLAIPWERIQKIGEDVILVHLGDGYGALS
jgi:YlmC/YmxH family sporulation protein